MSARRKQAAPILNSGDESESQPPGTPGRRSTRQSAKNLDSSQEVPVRSTRVTRSSSVLRDTKETESAATGTLPAIGEDEVLVVTPTKGKSKDVQTPESIVVATPTRRTSARLRKNSDADVVVDAVPLRRSTRAGSVVSETSAPPTNQPSPGRRARSTREKTPSNTLPLTSASPSRSTRSSRRAGSVALVQQEPKELDIVKEAVTPSVSVSEKKLVQTDFDDDDIQCVGIVVSVNSLKAALEKKDDDSTAVTPGVQKKSIVETVEVETQPTESPNTEEANTDGNGIGDVVEDLMEWSFSNAKEWVPGNTPATVKRSYVQPKSVVSQSTPTGRPKDVVEVEEDHSQSLKLVMEEDDIPTPIDQQSEIVTENVEAENSKDVVNEKETSSDTPDMIVSEQTQLATSVVVDDNASKDNEEVVISEVVQNEEIVLDSDNVTVAFMPVDNATVIDNEKTETGALADAVQQEKAPIIIDESMAEEKSPTKKIQDSVAETVANIAIDENSVASNEHTIEQATKEHEEMTVTDEPLVVLLEDSDEKETEQRVKTPKSSKKRKMEKEEKESTEPEVVMLEDNDTKEEDTVEKTPKSSKKKKLEKKDREVESEDVRMEEEPVLVKTPKSVKKKAISNEEIIPQNEDLVVVENVEAKEAEVVEKTPKSTKKKKLAEERELIVPEEPEPTVLLTDNVEKKTPKSSKKKKLEKEDTEAVKTVESVNEKSVDPSETLDSEKRKKKKEKKKRIEQDEVESVPPVEEETLLSEAKEKKKKKKAKSMTVVETNGSSEDPSPEELLPEAPEWKTFFKECSKWEKQFTKAYNSLYSWNSNLKERPDDLPSQFINDHSETHWQMILHGNKQIYRDNKKYGYLLEQELITSKQPEVEEEEEESDVDSIGDIDEELNEEEKAALMDMDSDMDEEDEENDEEDGGLFNMKDEDLQDIDAKLRELDNVEEEEEESVEKPKKKYAKTAVDDQFFSLRQMEEAIEEQEKNEGNMESILDEVDDSWGGPPSDYKYEDFFGREEFARPSKRKATGDEEEDVAVKTKKKKSVRWADATENDEEGEEDEDEEEEEDEEDMEEEGEMEEDKEEEGEGGPVLLGNVEEEVEESNLQKRMKKIKERISQLEQENLQPRSWELQGEVTAKDRHENTLLEKHVDFDANAKKPPEITEDFTEKLEAIITQRIKDRVYDDVIKTVKLTERTEAYRCTRVEDREMVKESLTEMYEKEYQKASGQTEEEDKKNPVHEEIEKKMKEFLSNLNALSHYQFAPPPVTPEIKIVSNMAAVRIEEVGPVASTDDLLLAPEETKKRQKGDLKADEERDKTDKLRARRKKKIRQRVMAAQTEDDTNADDSWKKKGKKGEKEAAEKRNKKTEKLRTSEFFTKLNETVKSEIATKTTKKDKTQKKVTGSSHKFVL